MRPDDENGDFYAAEAAAGRVEGDASSFCGKPFFGFGDMWDVLAPDIDDRIARYLQLAKLCGNFRAAGSGASACYLDYPECGALVGVRMAVVDNGEDAELETVYPVFAGYPARAGIVARYDWDNGLCGFVSVSVPEGPSLDFFVPSYGMSRGLCVPGSRVGIAVSGLAIKLEKIRQASFAIERGPLYEMQLARFLEKNPGASVADFEAPVVSMEGAVMAFPSRTTCWYNIIAPVRDAVEVLFDGRVFYRLLLPIARSEAGEEMSAYIYAAKDADRASRPAAGDMVECLAWLCADITPDGRADPRAAGRHWSDI